MKFSKMELRYKKRIFYFALAIPFIAYGLFGLDSRLYSRFYHIKSDKIGANIRIALITDLHNCNYGKDEAQLFSLLTAQKPDIILLGGDIFDDRMDHGDTWRFLKNIAHVFPVYYVSGNHEIKHGSLSVIKAGLENIGVSVLDGISHPLQINGNSINIFGVDDPLVGRRIFNPQLEQGSSLSPTAFNIMLSHRPELIDEYLQGNFDLIACGHAHGGQWRLPKLLPMGLYAPNQGFFPKYTGGKYTFGATTLVVSAGLARESTRLPRFYNRPEVVFIDVSRQ